MGIPYLSLLIVPLLRGMTDFNQAIRVRANQIFSISVRLFPLEDGLTNFDQMPLQLKQQKIENQRILKQLIDPSLIADFDVSIEYNAQLRHYQKDGIKWLWFLRKFHLHGILADDMGLGKTLQSLLLIAASYHHSTKKENDPSLIICPSTLVYHWQHEMNKFIPNSSLCPLVIDGNAKKRKKLFAQIKGKMIVIMSYNAMKSDIQSIKSKTWHYCVLDEGHFIKNAKSKNAICSKQICAKYRLILSGTPIQNNVLELWSLFDFLMPGFLGSETWFKQNFSFPISASYKAAKSSSNYSIGALKLEHLHKQILPFILRRLKCDVLKELPPKIIQDVEVSMSAIQRELYAQFVNSKDFTKSMQSMQYMKKLVVHPKLVLNASHPLFHSTLQSLQSRNLSLESIEISTKFVALKALIQQCEIEKQSNDSHKMLVFVQYQQCLDLIESLLLIPFFPNLRYVTLSGKLSNSERFEAVQQFNDDASIKLMLLTVSVGGLGLNLMSADVVVFMEMDWNPMKDLQAMDRAHRIGQKRTVHVFRIIVRNTIEWEIMNKQRFKEHIASTVISNENASLSAMSTGSGSILDLLYMNKRNANDDDENDNNKAVDAFGDVHNKTKKQKALDKMLDDMANMSTIDEQYAQEYDLKKFIKDLNV